MNPRAIHFAFWLLVVAISVRGQESVGTIASRILSLETGYERDHMTGDWGGVRSRLVEHGVHFRAGYVAEWMGNLSGGIRRGSVYQGLLELGLEADLAQMGLEGAGLLYGSALYPHGKSLSSTYVGDLSTVSSIDAYDSFRLFELWYEQPWGPLSIRVGQLAADQSFAQSEYGANLINSSFGWPSFISANVPAPAYPVAAPGILINGRLAEGFYAQGAVYDGDPGEQNVNQHGTTWSWDEDEGVLALMELRWERAGGAARFGGTYKLGAWFHTGSFDHQLLDEAGLSLADPLSSGQPRQLGQNWGVYIAADQAVWHEPGTQDDQGLGLFLRAAGARSDRNFVQYYVEGGLVYSGLVPGRDRDVSAAGVLWQRLGQDARDLSRDANQFSGTSIPTLDYELVMEFSYRFHVNTWWTVQPDLQLLFHPGGSALNETAVVAGVRSSLTF